MPQARQIQESLKSRIVLKNYFQKIEIIAGADVSFDQQNKKSKAAIVLVKMPTFEIIEQLTQILKVNFPYISGYFSFREAPGLLPVLKRLKTRPDVIRKKAD